MKLQMQLYFLYLLSTSWIDIEIWQQVSDDNLEFIIRLVASESNLQIMTLLNHSVLI